MKEKAFKIAEILNKHYSHLTKCYLDYEKPYELMISTILSAQCTDDRVNIVTKDLFAKYTNIDAFADADLKDMEEAVRTTGFYRNKAANIIAAMRLLRDEYNYELPSDINELVKFPGVGRKTANVVRGHIFKIPSVVVDTHVKRITNKLGLCESEDPEKIEYAIMELLPEEYWIRYNTQIIAHGRAVCTARSPKCGECFLAGFCVWKDRFQVLNTEK